MAENNIHIILLVMHNIALVGCATAPFYNRNLVNNRSQYGPKLSFELGNYCGKGDNFLR